MKELRKIYWTNELSIGNKDIDNDHKKLIEVYNNLIDLIEQNKSREEFAKILSKMTDYVFEHFKQEELYMQELNYPKLKEHKQYHYEFNYKVSMYNVDLLSTNPTDPKKIIKFLEKWWTNHILNSDIKFENYRKNNELNASYKTFI